MCSAGPVPPLLVSLKEQGRHSGTTDTKNLSVLNVNVWNQKNDFLFQLL